MGVCTGKKKNMFNKSPEKIMQEFTEIEFTLSKGKKEASPLSESSKRERRNLLVMSIAIATVLLSLQEKVYVLKITDDIILDNYPLMRLAVLSLLFYQVIQYFVSAIGDGVLDHYHETHAFERFVKMMRKEKNIPYDQIKVVGDYELECAKIARISQEMRAGDKKVRAKRLFLDRVLRQAALRRNFALIRSFMLDSILPFMAWFAAFYVVINY